MMKVMSKDLDDSMFRVINKVDMINKLNEMKEMGAAPKDIAILSEEIRNLQMNLIAGGVEDEG